MYCQVTPVPAKDGHRDQFCQSARDVDDLDPRLQAIREPNCEGRPRLDRAGCRKAARSSRFPAEYDFVVTLEVPSHVSDQPAYLRKIAALLKPGGYLVLATHNGPVLERNAIPAPMAGNYAVG
jgi:SAM-dependent methyltransferase